MKHKSIKRKTKTTKEMFNDIVDKLQEIVDNGSYEKFLKFQKNFNHQYSFLNLVLIFSQFPEATVVAGKKKWMDSGRTLIENAKKIWIVAPIEHSYERETTEIIDGEEKEKIEKIKYNTYRYVFVYDISQTKGEPIPLQSKDLNCDDMGYFYDKLKAFSKIPVLEHELTGGTKGFYNPSKKHIVIKNTLSLNDKASVLLHELSHALYDDFDYTTNRDLSEVFVESIAYIVASHFGLDTSSCSFNYIIKWAHGDTKIVIDLGKKIQKCSNEFIEKIENFEIQELELVS